MSKDLVHGAPLIDRYISDHSRIMCWLSLCNPEISAKTITHRKLTSIDLNSLRSDLKISVLCQFQDTGYKNIADLYAIARDYSTILSTVLELEKFYSKKKLWPIS